MQIDSIRWRISTSVKVIWRIFATAPHFRNINISNWKFRSKWERTTLVITTFNVEYLLLKSHWTHFCALLENTNIHKCHHSEILTFKFCYLHNLGQGQGVQHSHSVILWHLLNSVSVALHILTLALTVYEILIFKNQRLWKCRPRSQCTTWQWRHLMVNMGLPIWWQCLPLSVGLPIWWQCLPLSVGLPIWWQCLPVSVVLPIWWQCLPVSVVLPIWWQCLPLSYFLSDGSVCLYLLDFLSDGSVCLYLSYFPSDDSVCLYLAPFTS